MSRWDQKTEGHSRSRRDRPRSRSRSRSRSSSPVERRLREIEEEDRRRHKEQLLKHNPLRPLPNCLQRRKDSGDSSSSSSGDSGDDGSQSKTAPAPPSPPTSSVKPKMGFSFQKPASNAKAAATSFSLQKPKPMAIQMKLGTAPKKESPKLLKPVANAFAGSDSDDEPEEMPAECRMRMRNIGRETPTSSGPNSFGKTKHGFCDSKKIFEKKLNTMTDS